MYLKRHLKWVFLSCLSGLLAGGSAAVFLILLDFATHTRDLHPAFIWFLPIAGSLIGWSYFKSGKDVSAGHGLILDEIHDPKKVVPLRMAPLVLMGTLLTHLFGGSAGREGTAVQMGASLSDQLSRFFPIEPEERKILLVAGAGAGFGAAIGAPWAGVIFGMEVIQIGRLRFFAPFECLIASFVGFYTTIFLHAPHSRYPSIEVPPFQWQTLFLVLLSGVLFGLTALVFSKTSHFIEKLNSRWIAYPPLRPFIAGCVLVLAYQLIGTDRYAGLGIPVIQQALSQPSGFLDPLWKGLFTAITVGSGFKGGEFIPLVFMGATLGSALSIVIPVSFGLLSAVGFAAVFAGAANTPIACTIMAMEIFGYKIGLYAAAACFMSYHFSGHHGIYRSQRIYMRKLEGLKKCMPGMK